MGNSYLSITIYHVMRFIPTCMGNSTPYNHAIPILSVHPHVHGELARQTVDYDEMERFIPTCMGNSWCHSQYQNQHTVHPHVHGELIDTVNIYDKTSGSSPRAWGTPELGIIPYIG